MALPQLPQNTLPEVLATAENPLAHAEWACRAMASAVMVLAETLAAAAGSLGERRVEAEAAGRPTTADGKESRPHAEQHCFRRDGEYWTVVYEGALSHLRDTRGLRYLAALLHHAGREFHCTELVALVCGAERPVPITLAAAAQELRIARPDGGGPVIDLRARAEYRQRLTDLREELEEAVRLNDPGAAARARAEIEHLSRELGQATRGRGWRSAAERARLAVTKGVGAALGRISASNPSLGRHLMATIRRGYFCSYTPDPRRPIAWNG